MDTGEAADLVEALPLVKVSDRLTWLAEVILDKALARVRAELAQQYGEPRRGRRPVGFAVAAYGKFGGIEMGYGSDLDLLFLHDCEDLQAPTRGGPKSLPAEVWLSRLAQRVIHWLSTQTSAGVRATLAAKPVAATARSRRGWSSARKTAARSGWSRAKAMATPRRPRTGAAGP